MFEKKRGKRFLASVMALVMLLSLAPVGALATEDGGQPAENQPVAQSAVESKGQQAVVDTKDTNENTPTAQPLEDFKPVVDNSDEEGSAVVVKPIDILLNQVNTSNGIAEQSGGYGGGGISWNTWTVTYDANLPTGATLVTGVSEPDPQIIRNWDWVKDLTGRDTTYGREAQVSGTNEYYTFLGWSTNSKATTAEYTSNSWINTGVDTTLYAVWKRDDKAVKYFVLMPGKDAPSDGADQGVLNYYPSQYTDKQGKHGDNGGVDGATSSTGYPGGSLTATGFAAVPNKYDEVADLNGQYSNTTYLVIPSDLGYFNSTYSSEAFSMSGKEIVWYVIKNQVDGYHVDGYVKNVPILVRYHENFDGNTEILYTQNTENGEEILSGSTVTILGTETIADANWTSSHEGWTFAGWTTSQDGEETYVAGDTTEPLMTSLDLYAKWVKDDTSKKTLKYTVEYYKDGVEVVADKQTVEKTVWINDSNELTVNQSAINIIDKYTGYKFEKTEPDTIPEKVDNGYVIKVYYVKDTYDYTIEYYYDGAKDDNKTESLSAEYNSEITTYINKNISGYKLDRVENLPLTISATVANNVIKVYYVKDDSQTQTLNYTIIQHFRDGKGNPSTANPDITTNETTTDAQTALDSLITNDLKQSKTGTDGKTYVYVPGETKFTLNDKAVTTLVEGTKIHLYYYLDEVGSTPEKEGADKPDGIPDAWQYKVTFQVMNGNWNVSKNNKNIVVYVNAKNQAGEVLDSKLTASQIPAVGSEPNSGYNASGNWNPTPSTGLEITKDTVFTYTYDQKSGGSGGSGGSSRPSTPTVTIPDDVPTGLNGKDHYAYIIGYGNNDVRPQNNITRAEVATIFFRLLTDETRTANMTKSNGYNDVKDGDWFCCAVSTLSKMGIIKGYEDGSFKPNDPISRAEFAAIAARFDPDGDKTPATFADVTSHWAKDEISIAANHGWIKGYEDGSFKPDQKITRAETMTLVNRVLNRLPETKDDLHKDMKTWVDNMDETAWYYLAVQEATNSHYFKNKTGTKFEQWTDLRDTRDWSELEK